MLYILIPSGSFLPFLEDFVVCELIEQQQKSFKLLVAGSRAAKIDSRCYIAMKYWNVMIFVQITATLALREELTSVERRAEEERAAHNSTKMAAMERQVELEHRAMEASTALARIQDIDKMHSPQNYCHDPDTSLKVLATGPQQSAGETITKATT
ncbi:hypothetical protein RHMOL_Rhmol05G0043000 [Rhododendron molle]|uniref:Uncharacterized protein n=1 Tax=Rhododendron molle TaxID=49168 RepID=A0ACC0NKR2_RHOML|nr:hypothetical protein RHMOL_Rhmol05G0043000 [Rhododendron molle]